MSKVAGVFRFDGRPCDDQDESEIRSVLSDFGRTHLHRNRSLVMGHAASPYGNECQGIALAADGSACSWDGCLDNRKHLFLQCGRECPPDAPDAMVALTAYRLQGVGGLGGLIGDWSVAIWDASTRTVVLASDYAGIRPLYYYAGKGRLMWSSSLADMVRWIRPSELDDEYVASFLTRGSAAHRTPHRGIFPAPPGQAAIVSREGVVTRRFWSIPVDSETRYADERDYEIRLAELFQEAVDVRLSRKQTVCAELSGGLDSSSVVSMIHRLGPATPLHTFSYIHEGCVDTPYFEALERAFGLSAIHLDLEAYPFVRADGVGGAAPCWWEPRLQEIAHRMAELGSGTLLTGQFGDFIMGNSHDETERVAAHFRHGHWWRAAKEAFAWSQSLRVPIYSILWRELRGSDAPLGPGQDTRDDSLSREFRRRTSLGQKERHRGPRRRVRALSQMLEARLLEAPEPLLQIAYRHPFAHRPLVEFMMTIPPEIVCGPGEPRRLMRRAFAGFVPAAILNRKSKAAYGAAYRKALMPLVMELLNGPGEMFAVESGYLDRASIHARLNRFAQGLDANDMQLRQVVLFEFWLRRRFGLTQ